MPSTFWEFVGGRKVWGRWPGRENPQRNFDWFQLKATCFDIPKQTPSSDSRSQDPTIAELEELLNVSNQRQESKPASTLNRNTTGFPPPKQVPTSGARTGSVTSPSRPPIFPDANQHDPRQRQNEMAILLIRAMIFASKADGQVSEDEQRKIIDQLGDASNEAIQFLRSEFAKAQDVKDFCWSVPLGVEQQVYTMALLTLNLDNQREVEFLCELAHGLRLSPQICNQIHQRNGVQSIF